MNLEQYGVVLRDSVAGYTNVALEDRTVLMPIIHQYANYLQTDSLVVAGSLFLKRYAVVTAAAALDYYGLQQKKKDWLAHARFDADQFKLCIQELQIDKEVDCWEEKVLSRHLFEMVEIISKECRVGKAILWENIAARLNTVLQRNQTKYSLEFLEFIHHRITQFSPQWLAGKENPLKKYCCLQATKRKTCCRYYQLDHKEEGMDYCLICPLKK